MNKIKKIIIAFFLFIMYISLSLIIESRFKIVFNSSNKIIGNISLSLGNILILLLLSLFFVPELVEGFKKLNKKDVKTGYKNWLIGLAIMYASNIIIILINKNIASNESYNRELLFKMPLYAISTMVIIAPIIEELIFRLSIKDVFKNKWVYATVSGFIFGLMHMTTVTNPLELLYIIPYGALGFMFAKTVFETDNIWCSIFTHMTHNGAIIALLYLSHLLGA